MYRGSAFFWWASREASWTTGYLETGREGWRWGLSEAADRRVNALRILLLLIIITNKNPAEELLASQLEEEMLACCWTDGLFDA